MDSRWKSHSPLSIIDYDPPIVNSESIRAKASLAVCAMAENANDAAFLLQALGLLDDKRADSSDTCTDDTALDAD